MDIEICTLADAAQDYSGRLVVVGTFDVIYAATMPATHPHMTVALRLRFTRAEARNSPHRLSIILVDDDGHQVVPPLDGEMTVPIPLDVDHASINMALNLQGVQFSHYGAYSIDLTVDGQQVASIPLYVRRPPEETPRAPQS